MLSLRNNLFFSVIASLLCDIAKLIRKILSFKKKKKKSKAISFNNISILFTLQVPITFINAAKNYLLYVSMIWL